MTRYWVAVVVARWDDCTVTGPAGTGPVAPPVGVGFLPVFESEREALRYAKPAGAAVVEIVMREEAGC